MVTPSPSHQKSDLSLLVKGLLDCRTAGLQDCRTAVHVSARSDSLDEGRGGGC